MMNESPPVDRNRRATSSLPHPARELSTWERDKFQLPLKLHSDRREMLRAAMASNVKLCLCVEMKLSLS